jgi:hypothetical protein
MNIEDLTKTQLLLLTILVNFIISIATGVLVISMLDQSPAPITRRCSRSSITRSRPSPRRSRRPITTKPSPRRHPPEQQLTSAIAADNARTVLIYKGSTTTPALAFGVYLPKSRAVATVFTLRASEGSDNPIRGRQHGRCARFLRTAQHRHLRIL